MKKYLMLLFIIGLCFLATSCTSKEPQIFLRDNQDTIQIEVNDSFNLNMLSLIVSAQNYKGEDIPFSKLLVEGEYDLTKVGNYPIKITVVDNELSNSTIVNLKVVDTKAPTIYAKDETIVVYRKETFDPTAKMNLIFAYDEYDGDLTDSIVCEGEYKSGEEGEYPLTYTVVDSSGNKSSVTITYQIVKNWDDFLYFTYNRCNDFYWGKYFVTDENNKILNYDDALYYEFTNSGIDQFERSTNLQENTDGVETGITLERREDGVYLLEEKDAIINNYASTEFFLTSENGKTLNYRSEVTYNLNNGETLVLEEEFSLKKVYGKYYVSYFILPTS